MKFKPSDDHYAALRALSDAERRQKRDQLRAEGSDIVQRNDGALDAEDQVRFEALADDLEWLNHTIDQRSRALDMFGRGGYEPGHQNPGYEGTRENFDTGRTTERDAMKDNIIVRSDQSFETWQRSNGYVSGQTDARFGKWLRGVITNDWTNAAAERALNEGTSAAGGILVPTPLFGQVIDLARAQSVVLRAGATTVAMTSRSLRVPRLIGDPGPAWRNESAPIVQNDLSFDSVLLEAKSLDRLIRVSKELVQDSDPSAISVIEQAFAASIALEIDRVMLRGSGTNPEPRGLLNQTGVTKVSHAANGTALSSYDWLLTSAGAVRGANFEPNAHIVSPKAATALSLLKNAQGDYLNQPASLLPIFPSNQVPSTLTVGTSTDTSEIYTGQWDQLMLGIRQDLTIQVLSERYADTGEFGVIASFRGDVAVAQPGAFQVDLGIR